MHVMDIQREVMNYDVVIVGAGPAGLAAAIRLKQLALDGAREISVCVVEKGAEVGAHILSGALFDPIALSELLPDWAQQGAPLQVPVAEDQLYLFRSADTQWRIPSWMQPRPLHNDGCYIISLGRLCRWLAEQAEALGVEIYPGFAAQELLLDDAGAVAGVITGDMGRDRSGAPRADFAPGMVLQAPYTLLAEGSRGHLGRQLIERLGLDAGRDPQHYAIGLKEIWELAPERHAPGRVVHGTGWPLTNDSPGGGFLYHLDHGQAVVGLIVDLAYRNPHLSPFDEFQRFKHQQLIRDTLHGGRRLAYGARAITKGGINCLPQQVFAGGMLIGCDAGTLDPARIKGSHTAMKSGMLAAEAVAEALSQGAAADLQASYQRRFHASWLHADLQRSRNFSAAIHSFGPLLGGALNFVEHNLLGGKAPWTLHDRTPDHERLRPAAQSRPIDYPRADGKLSFDKLSSVFLSSTHHAEDQPVHLQLRDAQLPVLHNLPLYAEPAQRYCPAGVYEIVDSAHGKALQINAQNCLHCKTCDIKDPTQNIRWVPPEGGGGPNYAGM